MDYETTLNQIAELQKAGKVDEALGLTLKLRAFYPRDKRLHQLINKLKGGVRKTEILSKRQFVKQGIQTIKNLIREEEYLKALQACRELNEVVPENKTIVKLDHKTRAKLIESALKDPIQKSYTKNKEYIKLYQFYKKLERVFPQYKKLKKLTRNAEKMALKKDQNERMAFAKASLEQMKEWMGQKQYERVIKGIKELTAYIHKETLEMKSLRFKAKRLNRSEIEKQVLEVMKKGQALIKKAYKEKAPNIIKL